MEQHNKESKKHIWIILGTLIIIFWGIFNYSLIYKILPTKNVKVGESFLLHKGQTVSFGDGKYLTHCGFVGNGMTLDYKPEFSWNINGKIYPCNENNSFGYLWASIEVNNAYQPVGPYRPFSVKTQFKQSNKNPISATILDSDVHYHEWVTEYINNFACKIKDDPRDIQLKKDQQEQCYLDGFVTSSFGYPQVCSEQKVVDKNMCLQGYIKSFKNSCDDDCVIDKIVRGHLSSENCNLLVENEKKKTACFQERSSEEEVLKEMRKI